MSTEVAQIGHNNPPSPFDEAEAKILDLYEEAKNWCDGEPINSETQAGKVSELISLLRGAEKEADTLRKAEAKPHDDAKKAIQDKYNPLIQKDKGKTSLAIELCKQALKPWMEKKLREKEEAGRRAREEAEAEKRKAAEAMRAAQKTADLVLREEAERLAENAKLAEVAAQKIAKEPANVKGAGGKSSHFRTSYEPEILDASTVSRHYWETNKEALMWKIMELVKADFAMGKRNIPGVKCNEIKTVV